MAKKDVIVIEDDGDLSSVLIEILTDKEFTVRAADNAEAGIDLIKEHYPDVILLDTILPKMSGIEFLETIKTIRAEKHIPVIMLSNVDNPDALKLARQYNIEEYLVKTDWRLEEIAEKVRKVA